MRESLDRRLGRVVERGQAMVLLTLALLVLVGFVGLAVDTGRVMLHRREITRVTDSAALAAAGALSSTSSITNAVLKGRATARAQEYALLHGFDPSASGHTFDVSFPGDLASRKLVQVVATERVPLTFLAVLGINDVTVSSVSSQGEAAPVDIVLVQDVSVSQLIWSNDMGNLGLLVNPSFHPNDSPWRDPLSSAYDCDPLVPSTWATCGRWPIGGHGYDPTKPTTAFDWPPTATTNVPWRPFYQQQAAANYFIDQLDPRYDQIAVVSFSTAGGTYATNARLHQPLTHNLALAKAVIGTSPTTVGATGTNGLHPEGGTDMAAGIDYGVRALTTFPPARDLAVGAMILLTDGSATNKYDGSRESGCDSSHLFNCSQARADAMAQARVAKDHGIVIYTIFVGSDQWETDNALLIQWIADLTQNSTPKGTYTGTRALPTGSGPCFSQAELATVTDNYYHARNQAELQAAYDSILAKVYTRLVR